MTIDRSLLIDGLGKGLRVIQAFSDEHPRLTATEAGQLTGLTRTAARRYLVSLVHFGYADTDGKYYWLLPSVLRLGQSYLDAARLPRLAQPFLQRFSMATGETANLAVLDGHEIVYLARSNSPRVLSIGFHAGARMPAHVVSPGYAILSTHGPQVLTDWVAGHDFAGFMPNTITGAGDFMDAVALVRALGYSRVDQYIDAGLCGLAVPLMDRKARCIGAISTTYQARSYPEETAMVQLLPALQEAARAIREATL